MEPQKLFKLSDDERAQKRTEAVSLMNQIRWLDTERKQYLADNRDRRKPLQERLLSLLQDIGEEP